MFIRLKWCKRAGKQRKKQGLGNVRESVKWLKTTFTVNSSFYLFDGQRTHIWVMAFWLLDCASCVARSLYEKNLCIFSTSGPTESTILHFIIIRIKHINGIFKSFQKKMVITVQCIIIWYTVHQICTSWWSFILHLLSYLRYFIIPCLHFCSMTAPNLDWLWIFRFYLFWQSFLLSLSMCCLISFLFFFLCYILFWLDVSQSF